MVSRLRYSTFVIHAIRGVNFRREAIDIIWKRSNFVRGLLRGLTVQLSACSPRHRHSPQNREVTSVVTWCNLKSLYHRDTSERAHQPGWQKNKLHFRERRLTCRVVFLPSGRKVRL